MSRSSQALLFAERIRQLELQGCGLLADKALADPLPPLLAGRHSPDVVPSNRPGELASVLTSDGRSRWSKLAADQPCVMSAAYELPTSWGSSDDTHDPGVDVSAGVGCEALDVERPSLFQPAYPTAGGTAAATTAAAIDFGDTGTARSAAAFTTLRPPTVLDAGHRRMAVATAVSAHSSADAPAFEFIRRLTTPHSSDQRFAREVAVIGNVAATDAQAASGCHLRSEAGLGIPSTRAGGIDATTPVSSAALVAPAGTMTVRPGTDAHRQRQTISLEKDDRESEAKAAAVQQTRDDGRTEQHGSSSQRHASTTGEGGNTSDGASGTSNCKWSSQAPDAAASSIARCPFAGSCESVVRRLQQTVQTQHEAARAQELALLDAGTSVERLRVTCADHEHLIAAVRLLLSSAAVGGWSRVEAAAATAVTCQSVAEASITGLTELLKQRFVAINDELSSSRTRARELEVQLEEYKSLEAEKRSSSAKEAEERQAQQKQFYEQQLCHLEQKVFDLEHELSILRSQSVSTQSTLEQKVRAHEQRVKETEARAASVEAELQLQKRMNAEKVSALKTAVDEAQREAAAVAAERNQAVQRAAALETRTANYELVAERLREECELARQDVLLAQQREDEALRLRAESESRLTERGSEVARLVRLIDVVRDECAQRLRGEVGLAERQERERAREELHALQRLLDASEGQVGKMTIEIDELRGERKRLRTDLAAVQQRCATFEAERQAAADAAGQLRRQLTDAAVAHNRLEAERRAFADAMADCQQQVAEARPRAEQLAVRLAETELAARDAASRLESALTELERERAAAQRAAASAETLRSEVRHLGQRCDGMAVAAGEEKKAARIRERKLADKISECARLNELLRHRADMMQHVERELAERRAELADCQREAASLRSERDALTAALGGLQQGSGGDGDAAESGNRGGDGNAKQLPQERRLLALQSQVKVLQKDCRAAKKLAKQAAASERAVQQECDRIRNERITVRESMQDEEVLLRRKLSAVTEENRELISDNRQLADAIIAVTAKCSALVSAVRSSQERISRSHEKREVTRGTKRAAQAAVPVISAAASACEAASAPSQVTSHRAAAVPIGDGFAAAEASGDCAAAAALLPPSSSSHPQAEEARAAAPAVPAAGDQQSVPGPEPLKLAADVLTLLAEIQGIVAAKGRHQLPKSALARSSSRNTDEVAASDDRLCRLTATAADGRHPPPDGAMTGRSRPSRLKWRSSSTPVPSSAVDADHCFPAADDGHRGKTLQDGVRERGPSLFVEGSLQEKARLLCQELSERLTKLTGQSAFISAAAVAPAALPDADIGVAKTVAPGKMVGKKKRLPT